MKEFTAFLFLFLVSISGIAQSAPEKSKINILKSKISETEGAEKLIWLDSLSNVIVFDTEQNPDSILKASIAYALQLDSLDYAGKHLSNLMDNLNNVEGKPKTALEEFSKSRNFIKKIKNPKVLAKIYLNVGDSYFYLNDNKTSIQYYDSTQVFAKRANAKRLMALAMMYRAATTGNEGNFAEASKGLQKAALIFREIQDTIKLIGAKNSLSILYSQNSFFEEAKAERDEAIALALKTKNYGQLVSFYYNAATDARKTGNRELQIKDLEKAMEFSKKSNHHNVYEAILLAGLATAYAQQGEIDTAEKYLNKLKSDPENTKGNKKGSYLEALKNIAFAKGNFQAALRYSKQHLALALENTDFENILNAEKFLSKVYEALGDNKKALVHYKNFTTIKDSTASVQNVRALSYYQTIYETEKRDLKIKAQQSDIALLAAQNREKNQWMLFGGLGLLGIFGFIILIRSRNNAKKRQRLQEGFSQDLIKAQEDERLRVARELHDSVGQKLMLLTKKTKNTGNPDMESLAGNTLEELRSISRGLHPSILERLGISAAIKNMVDEVDSNTDIFFTHDIEDIDSLLTKEASLHLYRIIQEALNNMVKHAEAKAASVVIEKKGNCLEATITDNGKGFEYSEKIQSSASLGMKTLMERAKILHSKIDIKSHLNQGTTILLTIPTPNRA